MSHVLSKFSPADVAAEPGSGAGDVSIADRVTVLGLSLDMVEDVSAVESLERDWSELYAACGRSEQVFQSHFWCWLWCRVYLAPKAANASAPQLAIVTGRMAGRLVLVMPFVVERHMGLRVLSFLGDPVSQYGDVLAAPEAAGAATLAAGLHFAMTRTGADVAFLRKVRERSMAALALQELASTIVATDEAPYIDLSQATIGTDGTVKFPGLRRAKNRRRQLRRLEDMGSVEFKTFPQGAEAAETAARAIALKRDWLRRKGQLSRAFADPRLDTFFRAAADGLGRMTPVRVSTISSNGVVGALQIDLASGDQRLLHISVYDPRFERLGAGGLLLERCLRDAATEHASRYDLLPPRYDYKIEFANASTMVHDHVVARTLSGRLYARLVLGLRRHAKRLFERLPLRIRTAFAARSAAGGDQSNSG